MMRSTLPVLSVLLLATSGTGQLQGEEVYLLRDHSFTVPDGFEVSIAAEPPLVERPIMADFDLQGRLYVAESSGSNEKVAIQLEKKPHWISRLEDTDGDGVFDRKTRFADKLMFPEGVLWHDGSVYVAAPPSIWKLTDTDDDGVADKREKWFDGKTLTGCANDLHGPYLGPDGWIYWCKGAWAEQRYQRAGKPDFVTRAAHVFRRRPEGGEIEAVMTGGMDNPVELAFHPSGERFFTTTFLQHPAGGKRDGIIHAIYGGVYGKDHGVIQGHPRTGKLMPVMTHMGPAAACGLMCYQSSALGPDFQENLFSTSFNDRRVSRHKLFYNGATFGTKDSDFLVSKNHDFHPTDVLEDQDGSLLVIDTGGWYKLCCPSSQLYKPDIPGAIYRIRKKKNHNETKEDTWAFRRSLARARTQGPSIIPDLEKRAKSGSDRERLEAVWALASFSSEEARNAGRKSLEARSETVRHAALHVAALWRDKESLPLIERLLLSDTRPQIRRAAAEALGRIGDAAAVDTLLAVSAEAGDDRVLEHSLTYALIEIGDAKATVHGLDSTDAYVQRAALTALDQMEGSPLQPDQLKRFLGTSDPFLRERVEWILQNHPDWGTHFVDHLKTRIDAIRSIDDDPNLADLIAHLSPSPAVQELVLDSLNQDGLDTNVRKMLALQVMARAKLKSPPDTWITALAKALKTGKEPALLEQAVKTAATLKVGPLDHALLAIASSDKFAPDLRMRALQARSSSGSSSRLGSSSGSAPSDGIFDFALENLDSSRPLALRSGAARFLTSTPLVDRHLIKLAARLPETAPMEFRNLLPLFGKSKDLAVGDALVLAMSRVKFLRTAPPSTLQHSIANFPEAVKSRARRLFADVHHNMEQQKERLEELLTKLKPGDVRRGQAVFNSDRAACKSCHAIGYTGGRLGPDLSRIGRSRSQRDLLEAILYPSSSFVRSYEPVVVRMKDGSIQAGQLKNESPDTIELATDAANVVSIGRNEIATIEPGSVSLMPPGIDQLLTKEQLADLLAFLQANR